MKHLLIFLLLVGCSDIMIEDDKQYARDGYVFDRKEYEHTDVSIKFVLLKNEIERKNAFELFGKYSDRIAGYTVQSEDTNECTIYIKDTDWIYQPEIIGHEVAHCIWGKWHTNVLGSR